LHGPLASGDFCRPGRGGCARRRSSSLPLRAGSWAAKSRMARAPAQLSGVRDFRLPENLFPGTMTEGKTVARLTSSGKES
jgi:hypothetical protein